MVDLSALPSNVAVAALELAKKIAFEHINDKGANGYVLIGHHSMLGRKVVVKFYYWGDGVHAEPKFLSDLASPHVLQVDDAATAGDGWAYFVTPFCEKGDLDDVMEKGRIGVRSAVDYVIEIASGASYIHGKGFLHRDLKPSNVFCENSGKLVIGDFGSVVMKGAKGYTETASKHSLLYRTPEEIEAQRAYEQGDVYQLGIILYQLLGGNLPYAEKAWLAPAELEHYSTLSSPDDQIYATGIIEKKILAGKLIDLKSLPPWCPAPLISVIRKCCNVAHEKRFPNVSALITKLNNLRPTLPDWRFEPEPVLHRSSSRFRIVETRGLFRVEKMISGPWRKINAIAPTSLEQAIEAAEKQ